jgi:hypothetical protein
MQSGGATSEAVNPTARTAPLWSTPAMSTVMGKDTRQGVPGPLLHTPVRAEVCQSHTESAVQHPTSRLGIEGLPFAVRLALGGAGECAHHRLPRAPGAGGAAQDGTSGPGLARETQEVHPLSPVQGPVEAGSCNAESPSRGLVTNVYHSDEQSEIPQN